MFLAFNQRPPQRNRRLCKLLCTVPVNKGVPHAGSYGAWLSLTQLEHTFNDRHLCACRIQTTEGTPVIHHHTSGNHLTATVYSTGLKQDRNYVPTISHRAIFSI